MAKAIVSHRVRAAQPNANPSMFAARARSATARASAYHEAGHAVAALVMGAELFDVAVFPDGSGVTRWWRPRNTASEALVTFAGTIAEARHRNTAITDERIFAKAASDWETLSRLADGCAPADDVDPLETWERGARAMVNSHWAEIVRVATALCARGGRLSAAEVSELAAGAQPCRA